MALLPTSIETGKTISRSVLDSSLMKHSDRYVSAYSYLKVGSQRYSKRRKSIDLTDDSTMKLCRAVYRDDEDRVASLLNLRVDPNRLNSRLDTPLNIACHLGNTKLVKLLLRAGACPNLRDGANRSALIVIAELEDFDDPAYLEIAKILIEFDCKVNSYELFQRTALQLAVINENSSLVELLLRNGADVDHRDIFGETALHLATSSKCADIVKLLLDHSAYPLIRCNEGYTPVCYALRSDNLPIIESMLDSFVPINSKIFHSNEPSEPKYPLHVAVELDNMTAVEALLKRSADIDAYDGDGSTALHIAAKTGNEALARLLLDYGAQVTQLDRRNVTPAYVALEHRNFKFFHFLLEFGSGTQEPDHSLIHSAIKLNNYELLISVLNMDNYNINVRDHMGRTALHYAVMINSLDIVVIILSCNGADPNFTDAKGKTPLYIAVENMRVPIIEYLISNGADPNIPDRYNRTPIQLALHKHNLAMVEYLLNNGADPSVRTTNGESLMHLAVKNSTIEMFDLLAKHIVDLDCVDDCGNTPMHLSIIYESGKLMFVRPENTYLWKFVASEACLDVRNHTHGYTPLHLAAKHKCFSFVAHLLSSGADVHARDCKGRTALHLAVKAGDTKCIEALLNYDADVNSKDDKNRVVAELTKDEKIIELFVENQVRRRVAGLWSGKSLEIGNKKSIKNYTELCKVELELMKNTKLYGNFSYYKFLKSPLRALAELAGEERVERMIEGGTSKRLFPIYNNLLVKIYKKVKPYAPFYKQVYEKFCALNQHPLHSVIAHKVLEYLSYSDMKNFIEAHKLIDVDPANNYE